MVCSRYPREFRYYEKALKRKCFKKLRNNVWENKTKLILIKKAEYHYRIKLLCRSINLWVAYVNQCYKKKINQRAAEIFYEEKLKAKGLSALKKNVEQSWLLLRICRRKFEWNLKFRLWHQWKHYVEKRLKVRQIKLLADGIRGERLRIRFFYLWLFRLNEKRSLLDAQNIAVAKHESKLKAKYFKIWKIFTSKQICEMKIEKLAIICYEDKLLEKYIRCWKKYTFQKKNYKHQINIIKNFYESYLLKNYLNQWFIAYKDFKLKKKISKHNLAVNFYETKLLEKSFQNLWKAREIRKAREKKIKKFHEICEKIYLNFYINLWMEKQNEKIVSNILENKANEWRENYLRELFLAKLLEKYQERVKEREETAKIIKYSDAIIVHRAFRGWCEIMNRKINKAILLENSTKFYFQKLMKKSFEKWRKFVLKRSRKKMAIEYHKYILLFRVIDQWKIFLTEKKQKLLEVRNLERKFKTRLLRRTFDCWKKETEISRLRLNAAVEFCDKSKLSKAFYTWKKNIRIKSVKKSHYNRNKTILDGIVIKSAIFRWYEVHSLKQNLKKKLSEFKLRHEKRLVGCYFNSWRRLVEKMKNVQQNVKIYPQLKSNILIEEYLFVLLKTFSSKRVFNKKKELAKKAEEKMVKRRYLKKWLSFISWKKEKILRCFSEERKFESKDAFEIFIPVGKRSRRKPMIPDYMKADFTIDEYGGEEFVNQNTYRVEEPVNKKLPVVASFER